MAEVFVLVEGHSRTIGVGEEETQCTSTLVVDGDRVVVVDPGHVKDKELVRRALKKHGYRANEITDFVLTCEEPDHSGGIALNPSARVISGRWITTGKLSKFHDYETNPLLLTRNVRVESTPGHCNHGLSVAVKDSHGTGRIVGDMIENEKGSSDNRWRMFSDDIELQELNQQRLLHESDWIIPGHGPRFSTGSFMPAFLNKPAAPQGPPEHTSPTEGISRELGFLGRANDWRANIVLYAIVFIALFFIGGVLGVAFLPFHKGTSFWIGGILLGAFGTGAGKIIIRWWL